MTFAKPILTTYRAALLAAGLAAGSFLASAAAGADTMLNLTVSASVSVMPDELVAALTAQADAASAAAAQAAVNSMIGRALADAKPVAGVTASTDGYSVWHETEPKDVWHARQGLHLKSHDGAALLKLVGGLQTEGLALGTLSWQISPDLAEQTYAQAMDRAIAKLTTRAQAAAKALGLSLHGFRSVALDDGATSIQPRFLPMMAAAAPALAAIPPHAQATTEQVSATVSGTARLQ